MKPERFSPLPPAEAAFLLRQVQTFEPDYLLALPYVPGEARAAWLAILGFASEVIPTPARVSAGMLGRIRLEWWREALGEVFGPAEPRKHPVVQSLAATAAEHEIRPALSAIIDGMEAFLEPGTDADLDSAIRARLPVYGQLASALATVAGTSAGGEGLVLHALCRIAPDPQAVPQEDGTESPARRFARALAAKPDLEHALADRVGAYRRESHDGSPLPALPLSLFRTKNKTITRRDNPFAQKAALFRAALSGRP